MSDELIVEVGMKLDKGLGFYERLLKKNGLKQVFKSVTHDVYYSKEKLLEGLTENQMKNSCIRLRNPKKEDKEKEQQLIDDGYYKVFDTIKKDYHYQNDKMKSRVQLQKIKHVGLIVYYDNPDYYYLPLNEQRKCLLEELNSYGFTFKPDELGIDKLRTLYYGKEMYSENQNG